MIPVTNLKLSIKLKELGITKPSRYYYEWIGARKLDVADRVWYFVDNINAYSPTQLKRILPKNVVVNENVRKIGYKETDNKADKLARLLIYLLSHNLIIK